MPGCLGRHFIGKRPARPPPAGAALRPGYARDGREAAASVHRYCCAARACMACTCTLTVIDSVPPPVRTPRTGEAES